MYQPYAGYPAYASSYPQYPAPAAYAQPQQNRLEAAQPLQPMVQGAGPGYYDYSQANGQLAGANGDIASASAFTESDSGNQVHVSCSSNCGVSTSLIVALDPGRVPPIMLPACKLK